MQRLQPSNGSSARCEDAHVGRSAMGWKSGNAEISLKTVELPSMWNPYRANRFRRSEGASHQKIEATDRAGLSVHAGQSRGRAARGELGQGPSGRIRVPQGVGLASDRKDGRGIWAPTKFSAAKDNAIGRCCRIWFMAKSSAWRAIAVKKVCPAF